MSAALPVAFVLLLQGVPPRALVLAMLLSYVMCFAGLIFAYVNYRKRKKKEAEQDHKEREKRS